MMAFRLYDMRAAVAFFLVISRHFGGACRRHCGMLINTGSVARDPLPCALHDSALMAGLLGMKSAFSRRFCGMGLRMDTAGWSGFAEKQQRGDMGQATPAP